MGPRAVLWDIGNVIVRWDPRTLYSKIFPDPAQRDRFLSTVCTPAWQHQHDLGLPMAEGVASLSLQYPEHADAIAAWKDRWWEMFSGTIAESTDAIERLHGRGVPQFGLSNAPAEIIDTVLEMHPCFSRLIDIVVSGREKLGKPDPAIFALACERSGMAPGELLFVDDSAANIAAADRLGFHTHHFTDPASLEPALVRHALI